MSLAPATALPGALLASAEWLQSLGLFRDRPPRLLTGVVLALAGLAGLRKANQMLSQAKLNNYTEDAYDWPREVVVVTGGSGGIGAPLVRKLAEIGATVINLDIVPPKGALPRDLTAANVHFYKTDLANIASLKEIAAQIRRDHGDPTVLVNNAGVSKMLCLLEESVEEIRQTFDTNIVSHFALVKEFLPKMVERNHGHVVTVASMRSFVVGFSGADYACTKAAALALHEAVGQEARNQYNASKIRTSIVHPAFVRTPIIDKVIDYAEARYTVLEAEHVSDGIFKHILSGNSGQLFFPEKLSIAAGIRGWPAWLQILARDRQFKGVVPYHVRNKASKPGEGNADEVRETGVSEVHYTTA